MFKTWQDVINSTIVLLLVLLLAATFTLSPSASDVTVVVEEPDGLLHFAAAPSEEFCFSPPAAPLLRPTGPLDRKANDRGVA